MIGTRKVELRDQTAHFIAALLIVALLVSHPAWWSAALTGFALGVSREIGEERPPLTMRKLLRIAAIQKFDLTFWTLGGLAAWFIFGGAA